MDEDPDEFRDPALAFLGTLTLALGIRLPRDVALGVLPAGELTDEQGTQNAARAVAAAQACPIQRISRQCFRLR